MDYKDIAKANSEMTMLPIEKRNKDGSLSSKDYAMVPERVTAFRKLYPEGFILTEIISNDGETVLMQAKAGYYRENGDPVILGTGLAQEVRGRGLVNGTSHIENCETSAVGRALGFMGLGINGGGICSAEELANAITAQNQMKADQKPKSLPHIADVQVAGSVPDIKKPEPPKQEPTEVQAYLLNAMKDLREARGITATQNNKLFKEQKDALVAAGLAPDKKLEEYTMEEAQSLVNAMYQNFSPENAVINK